MGHSSNSAGNGTTTTIQSLQVEDPGLAWRRMEPRWQLLEALDGGTLEMRRQSTQWLPKEPAEAEDSYQRRLSQSVCPPYLKRLAALLAGMLTRKAVRLEDVPDVIREDLFDVDLQGNNLDVWLNAAAMTALLYGHVGVLVDFPRADEGSTGERPYWVAYSPRDILGWRTEAVSGQQTLTQLRLMERIVVPYGEFGEELVQQVRVLEPGRFRLYRKQMSSGQSFDLVEEGSMSMDRIPFAVAYAHRVGLLESIPPMEEIGWLNLQSYQRNSDLANQLHIAAVPRLVGYGVPVETDEVENGPETLLVLPVDARLQYIEPGGTSYQYQFQHLESIRQQINELGVATILGQKAVAESGLSQSIQRSQGDAQLMQLGIQLQDLVDNCLQMHGELRGIQQAGAAVVNREFVEARLEPAQAQQIIALYTNGMLTLESTLQQLSQGNVLSEDFDVQAEVEAVEALQAARLQEREDQLAGALQGLNAQEGNLSDQQQGSGDQV